MAQTTPINTGYTIINGTTSGKNGSITNTWIEYKVTAQSTTNNTSTLDVYLYSQCTQYKDTKWERSGNYGYVQIDNGTKQYTNLPNGYNFQNKHLNTFAHHTFTVTHNADGTKKLTLKGAWDKGSSTSEWITGGTVSGQITLPQIARASTISGLNTFLGTQGGIKITRQSSSFTHTITYTFGSASGTIATKTSEVTVNWTPPVSLISQITNATSGTGTLTCTTYSGDTAIGTSTSTLTLKVPNSTIADVSAELGVSKSISVTNPCESQLTYIVTYKFPSTATAVQIWSSTSKTYSYSFPTSLAASITDAISGTGTITVQTKNGTASIGTATATLTLSIPRASVGNISATMGTAKTITINNYGMSSLEYKITYSFGSSSGTVTDRTSSTSVSFTFPTSLLAEIPDTSSGTGTLTITTYNGTSTIGTRTSTLTLTAPSSAVPSATFTTTIVNTNPTIDPWGIAVQGYSSISASVTGTGNNGSTIKQMSLSGTGINVTQTFSTTPAILTASSGVISSVYGDQTYSASVVDSRGRSASIPSQTITVWQYSLPTLDNVSILRCTSAGVINPTGNYVKPTYTAGYSSLDGHNTATISLQYRELGESSWSTYSGTVTSGTAITLPGQEGVDVSKTYEMRLSIRDALNTVYSTLISVPSARRVLNVNPTGDALGIGGFADINRSNLLQVFWDAEFGGDVSIDGAVSVNGNLPVGGNLSVVGDISGDDITGSSLMIDGHNMLNGLVYKALLTSADDLNDIEESGIYYFGSTIPSNAPPTARTYTYLLSVTAMISASTIRNQIYIRPIVTQGAASISFRAYSGGAWTDWKTINDLPFNKGINEITSYTNLNDYSLPGVYFCSTTALSKSLDNSPYTEGIWDGSSGFRLEVINTTGTNYCLQKIYTHSIKPRVFYRTQNNGIWYPWYREPWENELYYNNRGTQKIKNYDCGGYLTNSTKRIHFSLPMAKSMANVTPVIRTLKMNAWRSDGGYTLASGYTQGGYDVIADANMTVSCSKGADNLLRIEVNKTSAFNGTNNTPIGVEINECEISFGESATITPLSSVPISGVKQGGCSDGTYLYQVSATNDYDTMTFIKYKISDGTYTTTVFTGENLGHANDMTYNPNDGNLYIATSNAAFPVVVMKASNMTILRTIMIQDANGNVYAPNMICYDRTNSRFYTQCKNDLLIYDNNMDYVSSVPLSTLPEGTQQTMETDGTYVYRMVYNPNFIQVSYLSGNDADLFQIPMTGEPEGIMYDWNGNWYVSCNTSGNVFYSMTMP